MNPSICAGSMPPYGWATYRTGTPRSGKMSRDMRSTARKPTNATAITIVKSEIGRRSANDTKFIVTPQHAVPRPDDRACQDGSDKNYRDISEKCSSYSHPQVLSPRDHDIEWRAELERRTVLGWPGVCCPDDRTWQSNSIFTTKFKFSFVKSSLMGRTNCGLRSAGCCIQATRIQHTAVEPRIRSLPSRQQLKVREIMCQGTDLIVAK